ncbi:hypothetical protein PR048_027976 [Dryococelus australis]|uniref:Uncharacterized protein n=1 Tax=Dryococelus australis TaxID=614101 RepID=A0ABQ9GHY6_9NEOP|nr:hypothetical protein PR048_027976 [Dryococelus australis]
MKERGNREIPSKPVDQRRRPARFHTCEDPGIARPGIEPGSPWWEVSGLTAQPPRPLRKQKTRENSCLPPIKVNRVQSPAESRDFDKWDTCRAMPLVGESSRGYSVSPPFHSGAAPYSLQLLPSVLETSLAHAMPALTSIGNRYSTSPSAHLTALRVPGSPLYYSNKNTFKIKKTNCSPLAKAIPGRATPDSSMWESCRTMSLVGGFSRGSTISPPSHSRRFSIPQSPSSPIPCNFSESSRSNDTAGKASLLALRSEYHRKQNCNSGVKAVHDKALIGERSISILLVSDAILLASEAGVSEEMVALSSAGMKARDPRENPPTRGIVPGTIPRARIRDIKQNPEQAPTALTRLGKDVKSNKGSIGFEYLKSSRRISRNDVIHNMNDERSRPFMALSAHIHKPAPTLDTPAMPNTPPQSRPRQRNSPGEMRGFMQDFHELMEFLRACDFASLMAHFHPYILKLRNITEKQ